MALSTTRLRREYKELQNKPLENIRAAPKETNILEWHYVIIGQPNTDYAGGYYHGTVVFPSEYPYKPPTIRMMTPSGRFKPGARLCLSMSDFHPESWNPMWSVGTILMGLYSFMLDADITNGSVESTKTEKAQFGKESLEFNLNNKVYCDLFPDLVELAKERRKLVIETDSKVEEGTSEGVDSTALKPSAEESPHGAEANPSPPLTVATILATANSHSVPSTRSSTPVAELEKLVAMRPCQMGVGAGDSGPDTARELSGGIASLDLSAGLPTPPHFGTSTSTGTEAVSKSYLASEASAAVTGLSSVEPPTPPAEEAGATADTL